MPGGKETGTVDQLLSTTVPLIEKQTNENLITQLERTFASRKRCIKPLYLIWGKPIPIRLNLELRVLHACPEVPKN